MHADIEKKGDIGSVKTDKALNAAMFSLLEKHNFRKITVRDICEEALISRATFYSRFADKFVFLKWWMGAIWSDVLINKKDIYEVQEQKVNKYIADNKTIVKNLFLDADSWTLDALFDVLHSILPLTTKETMVGSLNPKYVVVSNFYIGGMIQYILWQVKNSFQDNVKPINVYLYEMITIFRDYI